LSFGIDNIAPSIFENIETDSSWFSVTLRLLFLVIFICNIPFLFCAAKLAVLSIFALCYEKADEQPIAGNSSDIGSNSDGFNVAFDTSLDGDAGLTP
jgi:hypothetical protein